MSKICSIEVLLELYSPDVFCISEHFLTQCNLDGLSIPGYCIKTSFCRSIKKCGGVCILTKCQMDCSVIDVSKFCKEGVCELAAIKVNTNLFTIIVIGVYRPPSAKSEDLVLFIELLNSCIESANFKNCRVVIAGDFNVDLSLQNTPSSLLLLDFMLSFGFRQTVFSYTREFGGTSSIIDNIFTDIPHNFVTSSVLVTGLSDHHAQICEVAVDESPRLNIPKSKTHRVFSRDNIRIFRNLLSREPWLEMYSSSDINDKFDCFLSTMAYYVNVVFPVVNTRNKPKKSPLKVSLSKELHQLREKMLFFYSLSKKLSSTHPTKQTFINLKKEFKARIHAERAAAVLGHLDNAGNKQRALWSIVKELNPEKSSIPFHDVSVLNSEGILMEDKKSVSDAFNIFFAEVGNSTGRRHTPRPFPDQSSKNNPSSLFLTPTDEKEVMEVIKSLKCSKSAGIDEISSSLLRDCAAELTAPLVHLINFSFVSGKFPSSLKLAVIKPFYKKKGSRNECNNYRPISILSSFSKVLEKVFLRRLDTFLSSHNIIHVNQFGFRSNSSTLHAVFSLVTEISRSLDRRDDVFGLFLDLSKAFDMVNHHLLLQRLEGFGIRGVSLDWISSYLLQRRQMVEIPFLDDTGCLGTQLSDQLIVKSGVPQGSVLGPILFLLYINDLPSSVCDSRMCLFADDTALVASDPVRPELEIKAFMEGSSVLQWLKDNYLHLNTGKTKLIEFCIRENSSNESDSLAFLLDEFEINFSSEVCYLGITLDHKLNFTGHVNKTSSKLNSGIFLLRRLSCFGNTEILLAAYYGYIYPFLSYGIPIWGLECSRTKRLFSLQKKAVRIVFHLNRSQSCRSVFRDNNLLTFPCIFILESVKFFKKNPHHFSFSSHQFSHRYTLRNRLKLITPRCNTTFYQNQSHNSSIKLFNCLPKSLKLETDTDKFSRGVKNFLISKEYYSVQDFLNDKLD